MDRPTLLKVARHVRLVGLRRVVKIASALIFAPRLGVLTLRVVPSVLTVNPFDFTYMKFPNGPETQLFRREDGSMV